MSGFLIDTNVISEFTKPEPNRQVKLWLETADPNSLFASVIIFGEIRFGIEKMTPGKRRADLERWLHEGLPEWFESHLSLTVGRKSRFKQIKEESPLRLRMGLSLQLLSTTTSRW